MTWDLQQFLVLDYWLAIKPISITGEVALFGVVIFALFFLVGIALRRLAKSVKKEDRPRAKFFQRLSWVGISMAVAGWLLVFFSYEGAALLSMRLWYLVWAVVLVIWIGSLMAKNFQYLSRRSSELGSELRK